jgi:hypothetical protein
LQYDEPSANRYEAIHVQKLADVTFAYTDTRRELQYGWIRVKESSSLWDAREDDTFPIRINPANPEEYYSPEAIKADL